MRGATSEFLPGTHVAFGLGPEGVVSNVSDEARGTVPARSDAFAPEWKVAGIDCEGLEEVGSASVVPF